MPPPSNASLVWWVLPGVLGGLPMPWIHPARRDALGGLLNAWDDELPVLHAEGVRGVVCLLNIPGDAQVYASAGFDFHLMPVRDGRAPMISQTIAFLSFMTEQRARQHPVAVHCEAGLGRTGTVVASYLIAQGRSPDEAISAVRAVRPGAIETAAQIQFLHDLPAALNAKSNWDL